MAVHFRRNSTIIEGRELNFPDKEPVPFNFESTLLEYFLKTTKIVRLFS